MDEWLLLVWFVHFLLLLAKTFKSEILKWSLALRFPPYSSHLHQKLFSAKLDTTSSSSGLQTQGSTLPQGRHLASPRNNTDQPSAPTVHRLSLKHRPFVFSSLSNQIERNLIRSISISVQFVLKMWTCLNE